MTLLDLVALILVGATFILMGVVPMFANVMKDDRYVGEKDVDIRSEKANC